jgi:hypothetical protein
MVVLMDHKREKDVNIWGLEMCRDLDVRAPPKGKLLIKSCETKPVKNFL